MKHAAESATNVVVGYVINLGLVYALLHWMGYQIQRLEKAAMSLVLAVVAVMRGYTIRRQFHKYEGNAIGSDNKKR